MGMLNIFNVAGSAASAQSQRLNVVASNLANADSATSATGQPYRAKQVIFEAVEGGTRVTYTSINATAEDMQTVLEMGMEEGLTSAINQIDGFLAAHAQHA